MPICVGSFGDFRMLYKPINDDVYVHGLLARDHVTANFSIGDWLNASDKPKTRRDEQLEYCTN